jgi:uncharacterized membrane protein YkoI
MRPHRLFLYPAGLSIALTAVACNRQAGAPIKEETSGLSAEAKVNPETARRTALAKVPGGKIEKEELEQEGGKLVYSFDIKTGTKPGIDEVQVDAGDGSVVSVKHEDAATEAAEAKQDSAQSK